jgi:5-methylcytosine-specific restriction endonuclease McrA
MAITPCILTFNCAQCGKETSRPYAGNGARPSLCSNACKVAAYRARHPDRMRASQQKYASRISSERRCPCGCEVEAHKQICSGCANTKKLEGRAKRLAEAIAYYRKSRGVVRCPDCNVEIANDGSFQRRCVECRDRRRAKSVRIDRQTRRHRERAATVERFDPLEVLARDGWRCHLCGCKTPKSKRGSYAANAPELDHIVPLAKGGQHSRANTACSCRKCNISKSDRIIGQPSLFSVAA